MFKRPYVCLLLLPLLYLSVGQAQQYPMMDRVADKIIHKYQTSTCEQLWQENSRSKVSRNRRWNRTRYRC